MCGCGLVVMDFSQLMKVAACNDAQLQRKREERRKQQVQSEESNKKKKKAAVFSLDAVKAHLPKKTELPRVVHPIKKRGGRRKKDEDLKSSDEVRHDLSAQKQQKVERKKKEKWPLEKAETKIKKKHEGLKESGGSTKKGKARKPMDFQELMNLAKQQKDGNFKMKERKTSKQDKEIGKLDKQIPSVSKRLLSVSKRLHTPVVDSDGKRRERQKIRNEKSASRSVASRHAEVVGKHGIEQTTRTKPKCGVSSRTIDKSPHTLQKDDRRGQETDREGVKSRRLHDNPYLSLDDFPVKKTRQHRRVRKRPHLASDELDFIDDSEECDFDVSSHIREIFGYDKQKYAFEDPRTLDMEASYRDIMKEERVSARMGLLEDLEEERKEREHMAKRKKQR